MPDDYRPETRQDRITKQWVAFAPSRSDRPDRTGTLDATADSDDNTPVEGCPFCPGHEEMLPSVLWEQSGDGEAPWRTRVVPNKFPALTPDAQGSFQEDFLFRSRPSVGKQEVIVDTPLHYRRLPQCTTAEVDMLLQTYLERYRIHRESDQPLLPILFRNHGAGAGASIDHPHSQLIALAFAPPRIQREEAAAQERYSELDRCPYCAMIEAELQDGSRVVAATDDFLVFTPYAAQAPYEMWILPRRHEPELVRMTVAEREGLAAVLRDALSRLHAAAGNPDYNYFFRTALEYGSSASHLHWSLRIRPRVSVDAGFELGTGIQVNPSIPERDAAVLRGEA